MSRLKTRFAQLREVGRKALVPFITAGDPQLSLTVPLMRSLVAAGADVIELGVPFSDPMADGPVIQRASERALKNGGGLREAIRMVEEFRTKDKDTPVVLMGYLNPVEVMGYDSFAQLAAAAGVDGVLTVDLPPEEAVELTSALKAKDIDTIFLIAPTSHIDRIKLICEQASGFVYYVSIKGVTGSKRLDVEAVKAKVKAIRSVTELPIGVGFGISDAESAARISTVADAVVVGSALVRRVEALAAEPERMRTEVANEVSAMRMAIDEI